MVAVSLAAALRPRLCVSLSTLTPACAQTLLRTFRSILGPGFLSFRYVDRAELVPLKDAYLRLSGNIMTSTIPNIFIISPAKNKQNQQLIFQSQISLSFLYVLYRHK